MLWGATPTHCDRVERRAVGPTRRLCFVHIPSRYTDPLARSREALGAVRNVAEILIPSEGIRVGKGLTPPRASCAVPRSNH